jgi:hypothetical protein
VFADAPFASAPFAAQSAVGRTLDSTLAESAVGSESASYLAGYLAQVLEVGTGADSVSVVASTFSANVAESSTATDLVSALIQIADSFS